MSIPGQKSNRRASAPPPTEQPLVNQATPFVAHLVYGATADLVRRAIRAAA